MNVVLTDESQEPLERVAATVTEAGHRVVAAEVDVARIGSVLARHEDAQLAVVAVHEDTRHALELVEQINRGARCPVVLVLEHEDPALVSEALDRGADAYATTVTPAAMQSAFELAQRRRQEREALRRQVHDLESGGQRRALVERAKGVLMSRHNIDERRAFELIRSSARSHRVSAAEVAESVLRSVLGGRRGPPGP